MPQKTMDEKIAERQKQFDVLINSLHKGSVIHKHRIQENWEDLIIRVRTVDIRCQKAIKCQGDEKKQCNRKAKSGTLYCHVHTPKGLDKINNSSPENKSMGLYKLNEKNILFEEMKALENIDPDYLMDTEHEIKIAVATLSKYMRGLTEEDIAQNPRKLLLLLSDISKLKKEHYDMKHGKDVSFTKEQVEFLFVQMQLIIVKLVTDIDLLQAISKEIQLVAKNIGEHGFRIIN